MEVYKAMKQRIEFHTIFLSKRDIRDLLLLTNKLFQAPTLDNTKRHGTYLFADNMFGSNDASLFMYAYKWNFKRSLRDILVLIGLLQYATEDMIRFHDKSILFTLQQQKPVVGRNPFSVLWFRQTLTTRIETMMNEVKIGLRKEALWKPIEDMVYSALFRYLEEMDFIRGITQTAYTLSKAKVDTFRKELMERAWHPRRLVQCLEAEEAALLCEILTC